MENKVKIALGVAVLVVVIVVYWLFFRSTANSADNSNNGGSIDSGTKNSAPKDKSLGVENYYSANTWAYMQTPQFSLKPWRAIADDEWASMCGSFSAAFGYGVCGDTNAPGYWDRINVNTILSWFKAMNIDPVHCQGVPRNNYVKTDIWKFWKNVKQQYYENVEVGIAYKNTI